MLVDVLVTWALLRLLFFSSAGSVLIFVTKKLDSEELAGKLKTKDFEGIYTASSEI